MAGTSAAVRRTVWLPGGATPNQARLAAMRSAGSNEFNATRPATRQREGRALPRFARHSRV